METPMKRALLSLCLAVCAIAPNVAQATLPFEVYSHGTSMLPAFPIRCFVEVRQVPYRDLRAGDTVMYRNAFWGPTNHRLVRKTRAGWVAKGDNNPGCDLGLVTEANYVGVTRLVRRLP